MPHKHVVKGKWTGKWMGQVKERSSRDRKLFATRAEAIAWEVDFRRKSKEPPAPAPMTKTVMVSLTDWANKYLDYSLKWSPKTYSEKKNILKRLIKTFGRDTSVEFIEAGQALDYLQKQFNETSGNAANKERKNLMAAWSFGVKYIRGFPNVDPFRAVDEFPTESEGHYVLPNLISGKWWRLRKDKIGCYS